MRVRDRLDVNDKSVPSLETLIGDVMHRLFVAIELPTDIRNMLVGIGGGLPGARWMTADQLHLTLRFVGEVNGGEFKDIIEALSRVASEPFELTLQGTGHFPPRRRPETLWVGVEKNERLMQLHDRIDSALFRIGIEHDQRKFAPHVAIARLKDPHVPRVARYLAEHALLELPPFPVTEFVLYSSVLSSDGAHYEIEEVFPLHRNNKGVSGI